MQIEKCKMKRADIKNVKCQQKIPKAERILTFAICNLHFTMWRCCEMANLAISSKNYPYFSKAFCP